MGAVLGTRKVVKLPNQAVQLSLLVKLSNQAFQSSFPIKLSNQVVPQNSFSNASQLGFAGDSDLQCIDKQSQALTWLQQRAAANLIPACDIRNRNIKAARDQ